MPSDAQLKALFTSFDTSGDGFIDKAELTAALQKGGKKVTQEDVDEMIKAVDKNADNQVDFEEFKAVFEMAPDKLTALGLNALVDVTGALLGGLTVVGGAVINTPRALVGGVGSFVGSMGSKSSWKLPYRDRHGRVNVHLLEAARAVIKSGKVYLPQLLL